MSALLAIPDQPTHAAPIAAGPPEEEPNETHNQGKNPENQAALGWAKLPMELKNIILHYAMIAKDGLITLPCLTSRAYRPNVAARALRVNHYFYDESVRHIYQENQVVFEHFGSDLKAMCKAWSESPKKAPVFREVIFKLGDERSGKLARLKTSAFCNVLRQLGSPLRTKALVILLAPWHFEDSAELEEFTTALQNVRVKDRLEIHALDLDINLIIPFFLLAVDMERQRGKETITRDFSKAYGTFHGVYHRHNETNQAEVPEQAADGDQPESETSQSHLEQSQQLSDAHQSNDTVAEEINQQLGSLAISTESETEEDTHVAALDTIQ